MHQWVDLVNCWDRIEVLHEDGRQTRTYDRHQVQLWLDRGFCFVNADGKYQLRWMREDERLSAMAENLAVRLGNHIASAISRAFPRLRFYEHLPDTLRVEIYQICTDVCLQEFQASSSTLREIAIQHDQVS